MCRFTADNIDVAKVNPGVFPLDHTTPPIGHLITWNHEYWPIPEWQRYCTASKYALNELCMLINCIHYLETIYTGSLHSLQTSLQSSSCLNQAVLNFDLQI